MNIRQFTATAAILLAFTGSAFAHAFPRSSAPSAGATLHASPPAIVIDFTEQLEPALSRIEVFDDKGAKIPAGPLTADAKDGRHVSVSLGTLPAGTYKVVWHAVSVDTHHTEGSFQFTVAP
jgi:methionine-rich copper-binding protein CopC